MLKNPSANAGNAGSIPGWGRSPRGGNSNHSSILAWKISWTEEPGGSRKRVRQNNDKKKKKERKQSDKAFIKCVILSVRVLQSNRIREKDRGTKRDSF